MVKPSEAPDYRGATIGLLVGYAIKLGCHLLLLGKPPNLLYVAFFAFNSIKSILTLTYLVYMFLMNRHRDTKYGPADKQASDEAGMRDLTEFENKDFRYVL